jgi:DNA helicase II / ATP-dependent DNA helicase PcrA
MMTLDELYQRKEFLPNDKQREAIEFVDGPLFLTAGPGSGKTRVLLWRTLNLIVFHEVRPEEIFLSTFTEKAAKQLIDGLHSLLGMVTNLNGKPYDIAKMSIGTVHSICRKLLTDRRFCPNPVRRRPPALLDALDQYLRIYNHSYWQQLISAGGYEDEETAQRSINSYLSGSESSSRHKAAENIIKIFNRFSEERLGTGEINTQDDDLAAIQRMYLFYLGSLLDSESGLQSVDFSLLQQEAYHALIDCGGSSHVFRHVIIDEYQDTNSIQESLFFKLAAGHKNICVVGDDDQALYRFRGATVENLVQFEERCAEQLGQQPYKIDLSINYRSKRRIVKFYTDFINCADWTRETGQGFYRVADKQITAHQQDDLPSVLSTGRKEPAAIYTETAEFIKKLVTSGKIQDYSQAAFLFPSLKNNARVAGFKQALESLGIPVYAPRAGRFLEVPEVADIFGLMFLLFGHPDHRGKVSGGLHDFREWTNACMMRAEHLLKDDDALAEYVQERGKELEQIGNDFDLLISFIEKKKWDLKQPFSPTMSRQLGDVVGLSHAAKNHLQSTLFARAVKTRHDSRHPFQLRYVVNRVTSVDWSVLDLFYQLVGFRHFRTMLDLAENGRDEGPTCNLALLSQYLSRFMEWRSPVLTAAWLKDRGFVNTFFASFTYALFRRGESEYEDAEDPFPRGRAPFLTIHQSKGLEFPVVVLGSVFKTERPADPVEVILRKEFGRQGEPLERMSEFDAMRMFYVALSRAKNLLILPEFTGRGQRTSPAFKKMFKTWDLPQLSTVPLDSIEPASFEKDDLGRTYSYTGDYLSYKQCPRNYMFFRKYDFAPSRSQTAVFGRLVHQTIEDLHRLLIQERLPKS